MQLVSLSISSSLKSSRPRLKVERLADEDRILPTPGQSAVADVLLDLRLRLTQRHGDENNLIQAKQVAMTLR